MDDTLEALQAEIERLEQALLEYDTEIVRITAKRGVVANTLQNLVNRIHTMKQEATKNV